MFCLQPFKTWYFAFHFLFLRYRYIRWTNKERNNIFDSHETEFIIYISQRNKLLEELFPPVDDEITSEYMYEYQQVITFSLTIWHEIFRTNLMLGLGLLFLGIVTPLLQITLAYIFFKKSHIWSRVLNANINDGIMEGHISHSFNFKFLRSLLTLRLFY